MYWTLANFSHSERVREERLAGRVRDRKHGCVRGVEGGGARGVKDFAHIGPQVLRLQVRHSVACLPVAREARSPVQ